MHYILLIKKQAKKVLQSLARTDRNRIAEKIKLLGENPDNPILTSVLPKKNCYFMQFFLGNTVQFLDPD